MGDPLDALSWAIVIGNATSALLTGPLLIVLMGPVLAPRYQQFGWLVLVGAQVSLMVLGHAAGLTGFKWGPPVMLAVAALNWSLWSWHRRKLAVQRRVEEELAAALATDEQLVPHGEWTLVQGGRLKVRHNAGRPLVMRVNGVGGFVIDGSADADWQVQPTVGAHAA